MKNLGLVLEGGGMRGLYTAGVLDYFLDKKLDFSYIIGTSAGACNAASYVSKQRGRNKRVMTDYIGDPKYLSFRNLFKEKSLFGMKFVFEEIPTKLIPFDFKTFNNAKETFIATATNCMTGKSEYFVVDEKVNPLEILKATSSLPFVSPMININGVEYLDGGITDSIPIRQSIQDGNEKNVIVLTRNLGYRKEPFKHTFLAKKIYAKYPKLIEAILNRYKVYNDTLEYIEKLENENKVYVIRPSEPIKIGRFEKDKDRLNSLYEMGYNDASKNYDSIIKYLEQLGNNINIVTFKQ